MELDDEICYCFHISQRKILNFIRVRQPKVASQISECGSAGTGCGWCIPFLKKYFAQMQQGADTATEELNAEEYAFKRGEYIKAGKGTPAPGATPIPKED